MRGPRYNSRQRIMIRSGSISFFMVLLVGCGTGVSESTVSQLAAPKPQRSESAERAKGNSAPTAREHEVHKEVAVVDETGIPQVFLTAEHSAMCRVRAGDAFPKISLPQVSGGQTDLASLQGKKATVVLFWHNDPWMSATALQDLSRDVATDDNVAVVGIAVKPGSTHVAENVKESGASFPQLIDNDGKAFNQVGMTKMPRVYVLDGSGKIVWFDIEYSQSTRRELKQTLAELVPQ
jgi:peroxiredoxin